MTDRDQFATAAPTMTIEVAAKLLGWPAELPMGDEDSDEYEDTKIARWKMLPAEQQAALEARWAFMVADAFIEAPARIARWEGLSLNELLVAYIEKVYAHPHNSRRDGRAGIVIMVANARVPHLVLNSGYHDRETVHLQTDATKGEVLPVTKAELLPIPKAVAEFHRLLGFDL